MTVKIRELKLVSEPEPKSEISKIQLFANILNDVKAYLEEAKVKAIITFKNNPIIVNLRLDDEYWATDIAVLTSTMTRGLPTVRRAGPSIMLGDLMPCSEGSDESDCCHILEAHILQPYWDCADFGYDDFRYIKIQEIYD